MRQMREPLDAVCGPARATQINVFRHPGHVLLEHRERLLNQRPATVWLTGLSGAGKSTLAYEMERRLLGMRHLAFVLDGDNLRHHLNRDLGFTAQDRHENIRRTAEVASLMNDAGLIVFSALISPHRADRAMARDIIGDERFVEVHVSADLRVCEDRDPKGLYGKARAGLITHFTGVSAPYEAPEDPALRIDTSQLDLHQSADQLMSHLCERGLVQ